MYVHGHSKRDATICSTPADHVIITNLPANTLYEITVSILDADEHTRVTKVVACQTPEGGKGHFFQTVHLCPNLLTKNFHYRVEFMHLA